jgi:predicted transcriptional regulator
MNINGRHMTGKSLELLEYIGSKSVTDLSGTNLLYKSRSGVLYGLGSLMKQSLISEYDGQYSLTKAGQDFLFQHKHLLLGSLFPVKENRK